jgi:hypothetical protein
MKHLTILALAALVLYSCNKTKAPEYDLVQYEAALIDGRGFRGIDTLNQCFLTAANDTITKFELAMTNGKAGNLNTTISANYSVKRGNKLVPEGKYENINTLNAKDKYCVFFLKFPRNGVLLNLVSYEGKLEITSADEAKKRVSGKYSFKVANNGDTIEVKNGTFINSKFLLEK